MSKELDTGQIKAIIKSGDFDNLIGVVEHDQFECKGEPYRIEEDHQRFELAKDVSALANAKGGIILIGAQTEREPTQATDVIIKISAFNRTLINISRYEDVVKTWVYPPVKNIEIKWFESSVTAGLGVVTITVPDQDELWRPFLITRSIEPSGRVSTILFGYAERGNGKSLPMSVQQLHTILRDGYRIGTGTLVPTSRPEQQQTQRESTQHLQKRVEAAIEAVELTDRPVFILAAAPNQMTELESLFSARDSKVVKLLEDPPHLRPSGFGPGAGSNSRIVEGKCRRTVLPGYKLLEAWHDGTVILVAAGDAEFLAWGNISEERLTINQLVLIECSYLFVNLVKEILHTATAVPTSVLYRLSLRRMTLRDNCVLYPKYLTRFPHGPIVAPGPDASFDTTATVDDDPGIPSYRLVADVYHWFGFEDDKIPYTGLNENGKPFIDPAMIVEMTYPL